MGTFDRDVIVIGSGFGGSVSALRLREKGYDVTVLERGPRWQKEDFPRTNWVLPKALWMPSVKFFGILRLSFLSDVFVLSGSGVGGGSLVYANTLYVPPDAFFTAPQWSSLGDWKAVLMPYYRLAQFMLGVTQSDFEGPADRTLRAVADEMGRGDTFIHTPVGVFLGAPNETVKDPFFDGAGPDRTGCNHCGRCMVGCRFGAKNTLDRNYLYFAEKLGAEVVPMRTVTDVRALPGGGYAVTHERTGAWFARDRQVLTAERVVLSAGVLGTVKLLLECKDRGTLPNVSNAVGRLVRTNSEAILGVAAGPGDESWGRGVAITSSMHPDEHTHVEVVRYGEGSDALVPLTTPLTDGGPGAPRWLRWMGHIARHPLSWVRSLWPVGWSRRGTFLLVMQTLDNSIALKLRRTWRTLWRRALDTDRGEGAPNPSYIPLANQVARVFAGKVGGRASSSILEVLFDTPTTAHILGGAAIGASPETGVIDARHEVFGHPGLYVCDGSMVPANLGVNPSLTITAMTERAMSEVPVKHGATERHAVDPAFQARRVAEIETLARDTGSASLQRRLPVVTS